MSFVSALETSRVSIRVHFLKQLFKELCQWKNAYLQRNRRSYLRSTVADQMNHIP